MTYFHTHVVNGYDIAASAEGQNITIHITHPDGCQYRAEYAFDDDLTMDVDFGIFLKHIGCHIFTEHVMALAPELIACDREECIVLVWHMPVFDVSMPICAMIVGRYHEIPIAEADV